MRIHLLVESVKYKFFKTNKNKKGSHKINQISLCFIFSSKIDSYWIFYRVIFCSLSGRSGCPGTQRFCWTPRTEGRERSTGSPGWRGCYWNGRHAWCFWWKGLVGQFCYIYDNFISRFTVKKLVFCDQFSQSRCRLPGESTRDFWKLFRREVTCSSTFCFLFVDLEKLLLFQGVKNFDIYIHWVVRNHVYILQLQYNIKIYSIT